MRAAVYSVPATGPVCIAALLACAPIGAVAQTLPVTYFTHPPDLGDVAIAPDGKVLAATYEKDGASHLAFLNLEQMGDVKEVIAPRNTDFHDFQWLSSTRVLYRLSLRQPGLLGTVTTGELLAIDRDGMHPQYVYGCRRTDEEGKLQLSTHLSSAKVTAADADAPTQALCGTAKVLSLVPDDDRHVLVAEYAWSSAGKQLRYDPDASPVVALLDSYDGSEQVLTRLSLRGGQVLADDAQRARFAVGRDESDRLTVTWQPDVEDGWQSFPLRGFAAQDLEAVQLGADARAAMFIGRRESDARTGLYRIDLARHGVTLLYAHPQVDIGSVVVELAGTRVIGVRVDAAEPEYHWLEAGNPTAQLYATIQRAFPEQAIELGRTTTDGRLAIAFVFSDVNPGDYYLVDTQTRHAQYLRPARSWVDPARMHHKESIELKARDGLLLHGYLTRPRDEQGPFQLVVLPHGGPYGVRDEWRYDWEAQLLAEYGYAVLQVNYRGSGGYGEEFSRAGFREWGGRMQDDLTDATAWAVAEGIAKADSICIFGTGYGGYAALEGAVREPPLYRCVAGYDGLYDLTLVAALDDPQVTPAARAYLDQILGTDAADLRARSPAANAERIEAPVLLMAPGRPQQIEFEHARRMEAALRAAGKSVEVAALEQREEVYGRLLEFLALHLRAGRGQPQQQKSAPGLALVPGRPHAPVPAVQRPARVRDHNG